MEFWESIISVKEIKKPRDKFLRVLAKNQLSVEIFEKILEFTYQNINGSEFLLIFSPISQDFCHFIHLYNIPKLGLGRGGSPAPGLGVIRVWGSGAV